MSATRDPSPREAGELDRGQQHTVGGGGVSLSEKLAAGTFDGGISVGRVGPGDGVLHGS